VNNIKLKEVKDIVAVGFFLEELDMTFLYESVSLSHKEDPCIKVLTEKVYMDDMECSRICMIDPDKDNLHVGLSYQGDMPYELDEDWTGVNAIFQFCKGSDFKYGSRDFPDVPMARDPFPENQHSRPYEEYPLERSMIARGIRILDPSIGCYQSLSRDHVLFTLSERDDYEPWEDEGVYFSPIIDYDKKNVINFQFNPFHPMAIYMIRSAEWRDSVLVGTYEYRKKIISFKFDLNDKRWRIHSEDWRQILPNLIGALEVFDMVSFFDFANVLKLRTQMRSVEPYVIEPIVCIGKGDPPYPYSYIGPYSDSVERGVGKWLRSPYSRYSMEKKSEDQMRKYVEVTKLGRYFHIDNTFSFFGVVYHFKGDLIDSSDLFFRSVKREKGGEPVYYYRAFIEENGKLYNRIKDKSGKLWKSLQKGDRYDFMFVECHFSSFPRNTDGSIIYPYNCIALIDAIRAEEEYHEFLPMFVSLDEMVYGDDDRDEVLEQDVITISAEDLDFQRNIDYSGDKYIVRCYKCSQAVIKPVQVEVGNATVLVHDECYKCMCGAVHDLVYSSKEERFLCSKAWQCAYARRCYVCNYFVIDKDRLKWEDVYLHKTCVICSVSCQKYSVNSISQNKVMCFECNRVKKKMYTGRRL